MRAYEVTQVVNQPRQNGRSAVACARADALRHALKTEFATVGIQRFGHSIGVEDEAIISLERDNEIARHPIEDATTVNA